MQPRDAARILSVGRVGFGVALLALPERTTEQWIGKQSRKPVPQLLTRAVGARDLGLGAATLAGAAGKGPLRALLAAGLLADGTDLTVTLLERDNLPKLAVPLIAAAAGTGIALGLIALAGGGSPPDPA